MATTDLDTSVLAGLREKLNEAVVDRLVELFRESVSERCTALAEARETGDRSAAGIAFHSIRGSAQLVGARRLEEIASSWEERARDEEFVVTDEAVGEITEAFRRVARALSQAEA